MKDLREELNEYHDIIRENAGGMDALIPEGYFDNMQQQVMERIQQPEVARPGRVFSMSGRSIMGIAASILLVALVGLFWMKSDVGTTEEVAISDEVFIEYLAEYATYNDLEYMATEGMLIEEDIAAVEEDILADQVFEQLLLEDPAYADELLNN